MIVRDLVPFKVKDDCTRSSVVRCKIWSFEIECCSWRKMIVQGQVPFEVKYDHSRSSVIWDEAWSFKTECHSRQNMIVCNRVSFKVKYDLSWSSAIQDKMWLFGIGCHSRWNVSVRMGLEIINVKFYVRVSSEIIWCGDSSPSQSMLGTVHDPLHL